jgi:hypothetical protein
MPDMSPSENQPNEQTRTAEKSEAQDAHVADRGPSPEEEEVAERFESTRSDADRADVAKHEREMAERGAHQKGEGRPE